MYSGYYCKKCKVIPLIRPNLFYDKDIYFTVKCRCHTNYLTYEKLNNNYYSTNIEQKDIINEKIIEDIKCEPQLLQKIEDIVKNCKFNQEILITLKKKFLNHINSIINEIDKLFNKIKITNENIEKTCLILINSYKNIKTNYSNIKNIEYIINNEIEKINEIYFEYVFIKDNYSQTMKNIEEYIERNIPVNQQLEYISKIELNSIKGFLILSNEILLLYKKNSLNFVTINDLKVIANIEAKEDSLIKIDKDQKNNIICLFPNCLKIFSEITYNYINCLKNKNKDNIINIEPLLRFNLDTRYSNILYWNDDNDKLYKDKFILNNDNIINFFKYDLIKKSVIKYHSFKFNAYKIEIIKYKNNNSLILFSSPNLFLFDLYSLKIIGNFKIEFKNYYRMTLIQINNNELFVTINNVIYLLNLKNFEIKLIIKENNEITHTFLLNDKTIIVCGVVSAKRYSPKTFNILSNFYLCKEEIKFTEGYDLDEKRYYNCIDNCLQLPNSNFLLLLCNGVCELNKLII